jgi:hypothetical protein
VRTHSVSEAGVPVGAGDLGEETLVDPVALTEKTDFGPSPRGWAELSVSGHRAHQRPGFSTPEVLVLSRT